MRRIFLTDDRTCFLVPRSPASYDLCAGGTGIGKVTRRGGIWLASGSFGEFQSRQLGEAAASALQAWMLTDIHAFSGAIEGTWRRLLTAGVGESIRMAHRSTYASDYHPCTRYLTLQLSAEAMARVPTFDAETLANFARAEDRERDLLNDLDRVGRETSPRFQVLERQKPMEIKDPAGRVLIGIRLDALIGYWQQRRREPVPTEVKSWNPNAAERLHTSDDFSDYWWAERALYQLLAYMTAVGTDRGLIVLDRPGLPRLIPVEMDAANQKRIQDFIERAALALDHYEAGTLPDPISNPEICRRCHHFAVNCNPPWSGSGEGLVELEGLEPDLDRWLALKDRLTEAEWTEYRALDKKLKGAVRGIQLARCGDFLVTGKWQRRAFFMFPKEIAERRRAEEKRYRKSNKEGAFRVTIERIRGPIERGEKHGK